MTESNGNPPDRGARVGYGRPPVDKQFKPGVSGNPKGRPKKRKTVGAIIEETLARQIKIEENGRTRKVSAEEIIIRRVVTAAAKGDLKAVQLILRLRERYHDSLMEKIDPQELQSDKEILDAYFAQLISDPSPAGAETADRTASGDRANSEASDDE